MVEKRQSDRSTIELPVLAGGSVHCKLIDVSKAGARLSIEKPVPERFYLMLRPGLKRWCKVMWRRQGEVGVKFIADPTVPADKVLL